MNFFTHFRHTRLSHLLQYHQTVSYRILNKQMFNKWNRSAKDKKKTTSTHTHYMKNAKIEKLFCQPTTNKESCVAWFPSKHSVWHILIFFFVRSLFSLDKFDFCQSHATVFYADKYWIYFTRFFFFLQNFYFGVIWYNSVYFENYILFIHNSNFLNKMWDKLFLKKKTWPSKFKARAIIQNVYSQGVGDGKECCVWNATFSHYGLAQVVRSMQSQNHKVTYSSIWIWKLLHHFNHPLKFV